MENPNILFIIFFDSLVIGDISLKTPKIAKISGDLAISEKIKPEIPTFKSIPPPHYQIIF
jgi:hypothetical protein